MMKVDLLHADSPYRGFFEMRRLTLEHERFAGGSCGPLVREVLHRSDVAAVLLHDPAADKIVLVEQFRAGAYVAGEDPWLVDIVAGRIESGQSPEAAAMREVQEETGLTPAALETIGTFFTAPHLSSERVHLFCARVDSSRVSGFHGIAHEDEDIRPVVVDHATALARPLSLWAALALAWLAHGKPTMG